MKIRIRGNSVRFRLTKSEVAQFAETGTVTDTTNFGAATFSYELKTDDRDAIGAVFENGKITMLIPIAIANDWTTKEIVGFDNMIQLGNGEELYLLLEKDFKCLDESIENQSDNYDNPLAAQL
ncbi:MAG: hypothetical protein R2800_04690 [Flavipsychrobacter sp.]